VREHEVVVVAYQRVTTLFSLNKRLDQEADRLSFSFQYVECFGKEKADQMLKRTLDAQQFAAEKAKKLLSQQEQLEKALDLL